MDFFAQVPGLAEAVREEELSRTGAFLCKTETVGGFELRPVTLWQYAALRVNRHPVALGLLPTRNQLIAFLWLLNPAWRPPDTLAGLWRRWWFVRRTLRKLKTKEAVAKVVVDVTGFWNDMLADRMPSKVTGGWEPEYYSDCAAVCGLLAAEYGWSEQVVMDLPMKRLFQYFREIASRHYGSKAPLGNARSGKLLSEYMLAMNRGDSASERDN